MEEIDLAKTGPILLRYGSQLLTVVPVQPYLVPSTRVLKTSNIRIFPKHGGGIRAKPEHSPKTPFCLRMTDSDGTPAHYDYRIKTTCIELESLHEQ